MFSLRVVLRVEIGLARLSIDKYLFKRMTQIFVPRRQIRPGLPVVFVGLTILPNLVTMRAHHLHGKALLGCRRGTGS